MYDYGARNYDPALGRWMNIDPKAFKYPDISPYVYCIDNPLVFTDPTGMEIDVSYIYEKDKKGKYVNPGLVKAFEFFAKSKQGIAFLGNFAKAGQVIAGHKYETSGKFDENNTDLNFAENKSNVHDAETSSEFKNNRLELTIKLSSGAGDNGNLNGAIDDIGHESFLHVENKAMDYYDNKKLDYSTIDKSIRDWVDDAVKNGSYPAKWAEDLKHHTQGDKYHILEKKLLPILQDYYKKKNIPKTAKQIIEEMTNTTK